jgi:phospholipase/carboxylesterase
MDHLYLNQNGARTLLGLHGMGGAKEDLVDLARALAPHHNVLLVDGEDFSTGLRRYFKRKGAGLDYEDMAVQAQRIAQTIHALAQAEGYDAGAVDAFGFSNGANMLLGMVLLDAFNFGKVLALRPSMVELELKNPTLSTRIRLHGGSHDPYLSQAGLMALSQKFTTSQVVAQIYPGGHGVSEEDLSDGLAFFAL